MMVIPGTYTQTEGTPVGLWGILLALPKGMYDIANGIFMVFFVGAALKIIEVTGALNTTLQRMVVAFRGKELLGVCVISVIFSLLGMGDNLGMAVLAVIPLCVVVSEAMGFDSLVGIAMSYVAYHIGFSAGEINIFTTAIAQELAEIPRFSGMGVRIIIHVLLLGSFFYFLIRYCINISRDPSKSISPKSDFDISLSTEKVQLRHIVILLAFLAAMVIMVYGAIVHSWSYQEFGALFLALAIVAGLVGGLGVNGTASTFVAGCANVAYGALIIGVARSISIVLTEGGIIDTIVNYLSKPIGAVGPVIGAALMWIVNSLASLILPSGSGQAATLMPLMIPLADVTGISRHVAVVAFQFGEGLNNFIVPCSAMLMACLGMCKISYSKYLKWAMPIFLAHAVIATVVVMVLQAIGWS